jgi:hypothetical protein
MVGHEPSGGGKGVKFFSTDRPERPCHQNCDLCGNKKGAPRELGLGKSKISPGCWDKIGEKPNGHRLALDRDISVCQVTAFDTDGKSRRYVRRLPERIAKRGAEAKRYNDCSSGPASLGRIVGQAPLQSVKSRHRVFRMVSGFKPPGAKSIEHLGRRPRADNGFTSDNAFSRKYAFQKYGSLTLTLWRAVFLFCLRAPGSLPACRTNSS